MRFTIYFTDGESAEIQREVDPPQIRMTVQSIVRDVIGVGNTFYAPGSVTKVVVDEEKEPEEGKEEKRSLRFIRKRK